MTTTERIFSGMPKPNSSRMVRGFSMVELAIVIGMIALLTAIAIPIYASNVNKAKLSEADANLGSIRTQLRIYYGQNSEYPKAPTGTMVVGAHWNDINTGGLTGKYFEDSAYRYVSAEGIQFTITCQAESQLNSDRTIDESGNLAGGN